MKIGVLVVAYNAETTISSVLGRIPVGAVDEIAEILVLDDHSADRTRQVAEAYRDAHPLLPVTVLEQPRNLGYGGNQKSGYRYAMDHSWDVVVLLHGDGQYGPELLPEMVAPIVDDRADAVFGSRMMEPTSARRGGMPLYKRVGNHILTSGLNWLAGMELSEWHSGYRAYRVAALEELALDADSDGFDFDTEIILQLHSAGRRIVEVPIPTHYGGEVCYVNGFAYARDIIIHALRYRLGARGFGAGQLARVDGGYGYKPSRYGSHGRILSMLENRPPASILDIGCGPAWLAGTLRSMGHEVIAVDRWEHEGVRSRATRFVQADLDVGLPIEAGAGYDVVLTADVLEHVREPDRLLSEAAHRLRSGGVVIASVPNISHWYSRGRIALGLFSYDQRGILDRTHLRFFTRRSFLQLARRAGLDARVAAHTGLPLEAVGLGKLARVLGAIDAALVRAWPTLFAYQFVYELVPRVDAPVLPPVAPLRADTPSRRHNRRRTTGSRRPHGDSRVQTAGAGSG